MQQVRAEGTTKGSTSPMNPLRLAILQLGLDEHLAMMELRDAVLISDNAAHPEDVAEPDATKAIDFLWEKYSAPQPPGHPDNPWFS